MIEPDIGTDELLPLDEALERDLARLRARQFAAEDRFPCAREPVYGPFPLNLDAEDP